MAAVLGLWTHIVLSMNCTPFDSQASRMQSNWATSRATGFSSSKCFLFWAASTAHFRWRLVGSGMYTASTSGSSRTASYEPYTLAERGRPLAAANAAALSWERLETAHMAALGARLMARETFRAMSAQPTMPIWIRVSAIFDQCQVKR